MGNHRKLTDYIGPQILQHQQASYAVRECLSMVIFDREGTDITSASECLALESDALRTLDQFLSFIMRTRPHTAQLAAYAEKPVFSTFFNGLVSRVIAPILHLNASLGFVQVINVDPQNTNDITRWKDILTKFRFADDNYHFFMDLQPRENEAGTPALCLEFVKQLQRLLEASRETAKAVPHRAKPTLYDCCLYGEEAGDRGTIVTTNADRNDESVLPVKLQVVEQLDTRADTADLKYLIEQSDRPVISFADEPEDRESEYHSSGGSHQDRSHIDSVNVGIGMDKNPPDNSEAETDELPVVVSAKTLKETGQPLFMVDPENRILLWNKAIEELLRIPAPAMMHSDFRQILAGESAEKWHAWIMDFRFDPDRKIYEPEGVLEILDNDGDVVRTRMGLQKVGYSNSEMVVAKLRLLEQDRRKPVDGIKPAWQADPDADLRREELHSNAADPDHLVPFAKNIAENLENLWMDISGSLSTLRLENETRDLSRPIFAQIEQSSDRISHVIRQLKYFNRSVPLYFRPLQINAIIRQTITRQQHLFQDQIKLKLDLDPHLNAVRGDLNAIRQMIYHLCLNACEAMPDGGVLSIKSRNSVRPQNQTGEYNSAIRVDISDTGLGFDRKILARVFEPFVTTKAEGKGYGLGLAVVYGIVRGHKGDIDIQTIKAGGSTISIFLPSLSVKEENHITHQAVNNTVLIIDDETRLLDLDKQALEDSGYKVYAASLGREGLGILEQKPRDIGCIILDLSLPDISEKECVEEIRRLSHAPIILTSGYAMDQDKKELLEKSGGNWLQKPYTPGKLIDIVKTVLSPGR